MDRLQAFCLLIALAYFSLLTVPALIAYPPSLEVAFLDALLNTALLSTLATSVSVPVGTVMAYGALPRSWRLTAPLVTFTVSVPHTAIGVLLAPSVFGAGLADTAAAITLAMVVVSLPMSFSVLRGAFASLGVGYVEFLRGIGVRGLGVALMMLRSTRTALISASLLTWFRCFSELGAFLILAQRPLTVGVYVYEEFLKRGAGPVIGASLALLAVALLVAFLLERWTEGAGSR
ncbi:MAG: hypothetical protein NZ988_06365 [Thaumarchaeota archaeon]|nr:hypothetical protein [Candidatus Calditenuaceae archaeon]MDW8187646.1 hypothetical protein [Nitrososphaerota archaeon]